LPGRAGGAPDAHALARRARLEDFRHDGVAEMIERDLVAKEEGLVRGHGFNDAGRERARSQALQLVHKLADAGQAGLARERHEAAFDQILLVCGQVETGMIPEELTQILVFRRGHGSPLASLQEHTQAQAWLTGIRPTSANLSAMMSLSNGFMMYS